MKPISLELKNFFSHKETKIDFNNLSDISLITGRLDNNNKKSNGAGKSTVIEAVLFALYEKNRYTENKHSTLDDIVRWNSDNKAHVIFVYEINNQTFRITRTRDSKRSKGTLLYERKSGKEWKSLNESRKNETNKNNNNLNES